MREIEKIELWAHKGQQGEFSGVFCALFYLQGCKEESARVDGLERGFLKVEFKSTLHSRASGLDKFIDSGVDVYKILAHKKTVLIDSQKTGRSQHDGSERRARVLRRVSQRG